MKIFCIILAALLDIIPMGEPFLNQVQKRDSILVGDRLEYGAILDSIPVGCTLVVPETMDFKDYAVVTRPWKLDTLSLNLLKATMKLKVSMEIAPFFIGRMDLLPLYIGRSRADRVDTLFFEPMSFDVKGPIVDTLSFVPHDIKGQITYPLTFRELLPYLAGGLLALALIVLAVLLIRRALARRPAAAKPSDPPHIVALRELDRYRGDKFWAPDRQKAFYSGVTDALKNYIDARFGVDAPEMTTGELFDAIKDCREIDPALSEELRTLFETADFVKFAKHTESDDYNAKVLPLAVRFVTGTYQAGLEEEQKADVL